MIIAFKYFIIILVLMFSYPVWAQTSNLAQCRADGNKQIELLKKMALAIKPNKNDKLPIILQNIKLAEDNLNKYANLKQCNSLLSSIPNVQAQLINMRDSYAKCVMEYEKVHDEIRMLIPRYTRDTQYTDWEKKLMVNEESYQKSPDFRKEYIKNPITHTARENIVYTSWPYMNGTECDQIKKGYEELRSSLKAALNIK